MCGWPNGKVLEVIMGKIGQYDYMICVWQLSLMKVRHLLPHMDWETCEGKDYCVRIRESKLGPACRGLTPQARDSTCWQSRGCDTHIPLKGKQLSFLPSLFSYVSDLQWPRHLAYTCSLYPFVFQRFCPQYSLCAPLLWHLLRGGPKLVPQSLPYNPPLQADSNPCLSWSF